jgi:adenylate cyclase
LTSVYGCRRIELVSGTGTTETQPRYRILDTIGRGGMGEVCVADDLMLHRQVAVKFLSSDEGGTALEQLLVEARAAAALDHPFICKIHEVTELEGRPCLVMEYVSGDTLERRLRRGPLPLVEALRVAEEIAEAIEAAHERRVIHRDLKPANVMMSDSRHIKVMDFGLATRLAPGDEPDASGVTGWGSEESIIGTPAYLAPEQVRGHRADRRSDIFAFGILLYELLSGTHPFLRGSMDATLSAILDATPAALTARDPRIPLSLAAAVERMLAKAPTERFQSFAEVRRELRLVSCHLPSSAPETVVRIVERTAAPEGPALVGRAAEQAEVARAVADARAGRGALLVLRGDAGAGKSRLAEASLAGARLDGCLTLMGRCYTGRGAAPLIPYIEILEQVTRLLPGATLRQVMARSAPELVRLLPELREICGDLAEPAELPPELRQRFLFTHIREVLTRTARLQPLAIVVDDLQWADESTVRLTEHLAHHLQDMPALLLVAFRDGEAETETPRLPLLRKLLQRLRGQAGETPARAHAAGQLVDELAARRLARVIRLLPLDEAGVGAMLAALGPGQPPARLVRTFVEQTGGNPFFVDELFRHLNDEGRLLDARGGWPRDVNLEDTGVPSGVRLMVDRRIERISEQALATVRAAAVIGRHFDLDLLEAVAEVNGEQMMAALEEAERAGVVVGPSGRQERRWRFPHQLVCHTLTSALPLARRQRLHARVADAMDRLDPDMRVYASEVADHLYQAGTLADAARAVRALVAAGDAAVEVYAADDARRAYTRALEVGRRGAAETARAAVEERLGDVLALIGQRESALGHYRSAIGAGERAGDFLAQARLTRKVGALHWQAGDRAGARACYSRALTLLEGTPAPLELAHLQHEIGLAAFRNGDNHEAIRWAERAFGTAQQALDGPSSAGRSDRRAAAAVLAHASNTLGVALARQGATGDARDRIERSVATAREHGLLDVACRGYANLGVLYSTVEPQRAIEVSLTGLDLATSIAAASLQSHLYANLATAYCALTDRCEAEGLSAARAAVRLDREIGQLDHLAVPLIVIGQIHQCKGDLQQAHDAYREALVVAEQVGEPQLLFPCYDGLATVYLDRGDLQQAEEFMVRARDVCARAGVDPDTLSLLPFLC